MVILSIDCFGLSPNVVVFFLRSDFVNVARQVFALQLNDHSLSTSAVQFAVQDVNTATTAAAAPETDTFEQVRNTVCRQN